MTNNAMLEGLESLIQQRGQNRKTTGHTQGWETGESAETPFYRPSTFRNVGVVGSNPIIDDGDKPMCVACCPTRARVFGDLDDPTSEISRLKREGNVRILLEDKGTRPQVFYVS